MLVQLLTPEAIKTTKLAAEAAAALGRLDERLALSGVATALAARLRLLERAALAWADGHLIDSDSLATGLAFADDDALMPWSAAFGRRLEAEQLADVDALLDWLGVSRTWQPPDDDAVWAQVSRRSGPDTRARALQWVEAMAEAPVMPPLLRSAYAAATWKALQPLGRGDIGVALLLGDRLLTGKAPISNGGLVAGGLKRLGQQWRGVAGEQELGVWLEAVRVGAEQALQTERTLRLMAERCQRLADQHPRSRHLGAVLAVALAEPVVTARLVETRLKVSFPTAAAALELGRQCGVLREVTGQSSYRRYALALRIG